MIIPLLLIGLIATPVHAQEEPKTLYMKVKDLVEQESGGDETELAIQRFVLGVYHDSPVKTNLKDGGPTPFRLEKEENADQSLRLQMRDMCGDPALRTDHGACLAAQESIVELIERNNWHRRLGRELQTIASGYEMGIDGYPGKYIDVISRLGSVAQFWRAANDPLVHPILEVLTSARPWPEGKEDAIQQKAKEITDDLKDLVRTWTPEGGDEEDKKHDDTALVAAIRRYRHGVEYVQQHEGDCADAPEFPSDPANVWIERRWCEIEDRMKELLELLQENDLEIGNDEHVIYPSVINEKENIYIWMRNDDVGLQWFIPFEPLQAALYHPNYGDCVEGSSPADCYDTYSDSLVRGGEYPRKISGANETIRIGIRATVGDASGEAGGEFTLPNGDPDDGRVVPEPEEGEGICSHPFSKRGYLCRSIESENCSLTEAQKQQLIDAGTGGIVLTGCQPESFKDDVLRRSSGPDICGIGGWRNEVEGNMPKDTPEKQEDMRPSECAPCAVDVVCSPDCDGKTSYGFAKPEKRNGVIEICIPEEPEVTGLAYYLLAHELTHAQQICKESDLQSYDRAGLTVDDTDEKIASCCAVEREAYFVTCKLMALDGILERADIPLDQCANALANNTCGKLDETPDDDDYACTSDGIDPEVINTEIGNAIAELTEEGLLDAPSTCTEAMEDPRIKTYYNSFPLSCSPGCQAKYQNTIGNNLCYTGQCLEETHEFARAHPGRMGLTSTDEDFPMDSCELPDPKLGEFEVPPALMGPVFPKYNPALVMQQLDLALCQINGLPAKTPPIVCAFDPLKRLNLPPISLGQSVEDLALQPEQYDLTGLGIQYAAQGIGARITGDMFAQYMQIGARNFADLLNLTHHLFNSVGELKFPGTMCPRFASDSFVCPTPEPEA